MRSPDAPILGQVALSYCPIINRERQIMATRLSVFPVGHARWLPVGELMSMVSQVWPEQGQPVVLSVRSEDLVADLLQVQPAANVMVEVPKFMACDPVHQDAILTLAAHGNTLLLSGRPAQPLPKALLGAFKYSIIDLADERRLDACPAPAGVTRSIGFFQEGVHSIEQMEGAFSRGAVAVLGWPVEDIGQCAVRSAAAQPDLQVTTTLLQQVNREAPLEALEETLKFDPALAFKLLRYINSPVFGLQTKVSTFGQALMLLGYQRLKRWLALLLVTSGSEPNVRPVIYAAVRRGLLMEALAPADSPAEIRGELFICGVFSLLDRMFMRPFPELLKNLPVPDAVYQALIQERGPFYGLLELVRTLEGGTGPDVRERIVANQLSLRHVNRALLHALVSAFHLD